MEEIYKIIPDTNDLYEASNLGNVRRVGGKAHSTKMRSDGYIRIGLYITPCVQHKYYVHRLVASAFMGKIPDGYEVNHKDGNRANNRVDNLEIVTPAENMMHAYRVLGRKNLQGESHHRTKLKASDVIKIRELRSKGLLIREIHELYSHLIGMDGIYDICLRRCWNHV